MAADYILPNPSVSRPSLGLTQRSTPHTIGFGDLCAERSGWWCLCHRRQRAAWFGRPVRVLLADGRRAGCLTARWPCLCSLATVGWASETGLVHCRAQETGLEFCAGDTQAKAAVSKNWQRDGPKSLAPAIPHEPRSPALGMVNATSVKIGFCGGQRLAPIPPSVQSDRETHSPAPDIEPVTQTCTGQNWQTPTH